MRSFCTAKASLIFSTKNFSVFGYKAVKHLTSWPLNELVKLTMLWTTWPWSFECIIILLFYFLNCSFCFRAKKWQRGYRHAALHFGLYLPIHHAWTSGGLMTGEKLISREWHQKSPTYGHVTKLFSKSEFKHIGNKQSKIREFSSKSCGFLGSIRCRK